VDGAEGPHERRLERAHSAGEEGWYVWNPANSRKGECCNVHNVVGWIDGACFSFKGSHAIHATCNMNLDSNGTSWHTNALLTLLRSLLDRIRSSRSPRYGSSW
jgi:hypothetical protein